MKPESETPPSTALTRRDALMRALKGAVATAAAAPIVAQATAPAPSQQPEPAFVPENDYPFFGAEPPSGK